MNELIRVRNEKKLNLAPSSMIETSINNTIKNEMSHNW